MRKLILAAALTAATFTTGVAKAALLEFDVTAVFHNNGDLSGGFLFDTSTQSVTDIGVTGGAGFGSVSYDSSAGSIASLIRDGTDAAPFDFTTIEIYFDAAKTTLLKFDIFGFNTVMPGLNVGDDIFLGTQGVEQVAGVGTNAFIDSTIVVTRLPDPVVNPGAVPLPAGFPLMLVGLGAFGILRRKKA